MFSISAAAAATTPQGSSSKNLKFAKASLGLKSSCSFIWWN